LKNYLYPILLQYGGGRPALVFCASRREAEDSAAKARARKREKREKNAMHFLRSSQSVLICVFLSFFFSSLRWLRAFRAARGTLAALRTLSCAAPPRRAPLHPQPPPLNLPA
jgi:hypothetical protein